MVYSPPVTAGWLHSIDRAQSDLMKKAEHITVPVLVMHSSRRVEGCGWTPEFQKGDAVLNPHELQKRGMKLGQKSTRQVSTITDGMHDLILSEPASRESAYDTIFRFIRAH